MNRLVLIVGTIALLAVSVAHGELQFRGNETIPEENRPKMQSRNSTGDKKERSAEFGEDGTTMKAKTKNGRKAVEVAVVFIAEFMANGTPVGGDDSVISLQNDENRKRMEVKTESGDNIIKEDKVDPDLLDKHDRVPRKEESPPPSSRKRRAAPDAPQPDPDNSLNTTSNIEAQSQEIILNLDKRDEMGNGVNLELTLIMILVETDGQVQFGSEKAVLKEGDMKVQMELSYLFCGGMNNPRICLDGDGAPTVGKYIDVCFDFKGSSGNNEDPEAKTNEEDDLKKFQLSEGDVAFSQRYIVDGVIYVMDNDTVKDMEKTVDGSKRKFICVSFFRPDGEDTLTVVYDPTASTEDEDEEDDEDSGAGHVKFALIGWIFAAILNIVL